MRATKKIRTPHRNDLIGQVILCSQPSQRHSRRKAVTAQRLLMYATLLGCDAVTPSAQ